VGDYVLEIRRGTEYGLPLFRSFDTNDRHAQEITLEIPVAGDIAHGDTFTVSDGVNVATFEFLDATLPAAGVGEPVYFLGTDTAGEIANAVAQAINNVQLLDVSATSIKTSNRVDLFGAAVVDGVAHIVFGDVASAATFPQGPVQITGTTTDGNLLRDVIIGTGMTPVRDATLVGGPSSAGFWTDGVQQGILLTTGDANIAAGPNTVDGEDGGLASGYRDYELNSEFGVATKDATSLEFDFEWVGGDLQIDYVFASEEYNRFVYSGRNDVFAIFLEQYDDNYGNWIDKNIAVLPQTDVTVPISIDTVNGGNPLGINASHPQFYRDNDPTQAGMFVDKIGYDGFTDVFSARAHNILPGLYRIKFAIADVGDQAGDSGVFIRMTPRRISANTSDVNHARQQGQVIIDSNEITHSKEYGIVVDAGQRDSAANWALPGSAAPLREINTERLVPGVTIENNLIAFSEQGGIHFSGEDSPANMPAASVPFGRIVNNTIMGGVATTSTPTTSEADVVLAEPLGDEVLMYDSFDWGFYTEPAYQNDDFSSEPIDFGFTFELYGGSYTQFYLNNNGNITFTKPLWEFTAEGFPYVDWFSGEAIPIVAPFWGDVDTRPYPDGSSAGTVHLTTPQTVLDAGGTLPTDNPFIQIDWVDVGYFSTIGSWGFEGETANLGYRNSFTLYIEDNPAGDIVAFIYHDLNWTTGDASGGIDGFQGPNTWYFYDSDYGAAQVGFDAGDGENYASVARPGTREDLDQLLADGQYVFRIDPVTGVPIVGSGSQGAGIVVDEFASPTLLNNIVSGLETGIVVDNTSQGTVIGGTVYHDNIANTSPGVDIGSFAIDFSDPAAGFQGLPLFVDAAAGNFYLAEGSPAIDSSINALGDRPAMTTVREPLGISESPILSPEQDLYGQLRADDPWIPSYPGLGSNIFKDRGAIDRIDFDGPLAELREPQDNDGLGKDREPARHHVRWVNENATEFSIQLTDSGIGIDDKTVISQAVRVYRDGNILLSAPRDYTFSYNGTNDTITLIPAAGKWFDGSDYLIELDNSDDPGFDSNNVPAIRDLADNLLFANQPDGTTSVLIELRGLDFGDAPAPYPSLLDDDGPRHVLLRNYALGIGANSEQSPLRNPTGTGDQFDDGVVFDTALLMNATVDITVTVATSPNAPPERQGGLLDAWIDYNRDGVWTDDEKLALATAAVLPPGINNDFVIRGATLGISLGEVNVLFTNTPGLDDQANVTFHEDTHTLEIEVDPTPGSGTTANTVIAAVNEEGTFRAELDVTIDPTNDGSGQVSLLGSVATTTLGSPYLVAGDNLLTIDTHVALPPTFEHGDTTFARFRLSSQGGLGPIDEVQEAQDGEVEDYQLVMVDYLQDFGDAPSPYPTLLNDMGAWHRLGSDLFLGVREVGSEFDPVDSELDGQPNPSATGDDEQNRSDEDGVALDAEFERGLPTTITVTASVAGKLDAWMDFNANGSWEDPGEQIFASWDLEAGPNELEVMVSEEAELGTTFARFRLSSTGGLTYSGGAIDGEVEDYAIVIVDPPQDFGDAPDDELDPGYPTLLANDGARHRRDPRVPLFLGSGIDFDPDGQPDALARGDDNDGNDDEDGVNLTAALIQGHPTQITVNVSQDSLLDAWVDFNADGVWSNDEWLALATTRITPNGGNNDILVQGVALGTGLDNTRVVFDDGASDGQAIATFDQAAGTLTIAIDPLQTTANTVIAAINGQGTFTAALDHASEDTADEIINDGTGLIGYSALVPNSVVSLTSQPLVEGDNELLFAVPIDATLGTTYVRFRVSTAGGLSPAGRALDGEVEDYQIAIVEAPEDFGDARDSVAFPGYPTLLIHDGARHRVLPGFHLGPAEVDNELDGQPNYSATGDDNDGNDDEDGITFVEDLIPGMPGTVSVDVVNTTGEDGYLNAWIDFNGDGDWADAGEQILTDILVSAGVQLLEFPVPDEIDGVELVAQTTAARFRLSHEQGLSYAGPPQGEDAPDGEVEDYGDVRIIVGDSSIGGRVFDDRNANGKWETHSILTEAEFELLPLDEGYVVLSSETVSSSSPEAVPGNDVFYRVQEGELGFSFEYFGESFTDFYVTDNGNIVFLPSYYISDYYYYYYYDRAYWEENYIPFHYSWGASLPSINPFYANVDLRGLDPDTSLPTGDVRIHSGINAANSNPFVQIDWVDVGYFDLHVDKTNTFSLYIEDDPGGDIVAFIYHDLQWATADYDSYEWWPDGTDGFGGYGTRVGFGDYYTLARPSTPEDLQQLMDQGQYVVRFDPVTGVPVTSNDTPLADVVVYIDLE